MSAVESKILLHRNIYIPINNILKMNTSNDKIDTYYEKYTEYKYTEQDIVTELKRVAEYIVQNAESNVKEHYKTMRNVYTNLRAKGHVDGEYQGTSISNILEAIMINYCSSDQKLDYPESVKLNAKPVDKTVIDYDTGMPAHDIGSTVYDKEKKAFVTVNNPLASQHLPL